MNRRNEQLLALFAYAVSFAIVVVIVKALVTAYLRLNAAQ